MIAAVAACAVSAGVISLVTEGCPNAVLIVEADLSSSLRAAEVMQPVVISGDTSGDIEETAGSSHSIWARLIAQ